MNYSTKTMVYEIMKNKDSYTDMNFTAMINSFAEIVQRLHQSDPEFRIDEVNEVELQAEIDRQVLAGASQSEKDRYMQAKKNLDQLARQN